jgi:hypothetical protein
MTEKDVDPNLRPGQRLLRYFLIAFWLSGGALSFGIELFTPTEYRDYVALATGMVFLVFFAGPFTFLAYWYGGFSKWLK